MPELPEVEIIRLGLEKYVLGLRIKDICVRTQKILWGNVENIIKAKITKIQRFGKALVINLDNGWCLAIHLKMTGQIIYTSPSLHINIKRSPKTGGKLSNKSTHVIITLANSDDNYTRHLYYNDQRRFGWLKIVKQQSLRDLSFFKNLGYEINIKPQKKISRLLTETIFVNLLKPLSLSIKSLLLNQRIIAGVGNIYANEALFAARIDPRRQAKSLSDREAKRLYEVILAVLSNGLKYGGASKTNFVSVLRRGRIFPKTYADLQ